MLKSRNFHLPPTAKIFMAAAVAVVLPALILIFFQFRSMTELQAKTKAAIKENLRQTLQTAIGAVHTQTKQLADDSFSSFSAANFKADGREKIEDFCKQIKTRHPEAESVFVISQCACQGQPFAAVFNSEEFQWTENPADGDVNSEVSKIIAAIRATHQNSQQSVSENDVLFARQNCPLCQHNKNTTEKLYVYKAVKDESGNKIIGFIGLTLKAEYVSEQLNRQITSNAELQGVTDKSELAVSVFDENARPIYSSSSNAQSGEVQSAFEPMFPNWNAALGFRDKTVDALASENFRQSVLINIGVLISLIVGIILLLQAVFQQMRLAKAKSAFVSNVSHELKTPLALIRLFAETLELNRVKDTSQAQEYYRIIGNESRRLTRLIDNILDFSKIEAGHKQYQFSATDVGEIAREVAESYRYSIKNAGFDFEINIRQNLPPIPIDRDAIAQTLLNLINNAVKYSNLEKKIKLDVYTRSAKLVIEVADSGIGISRAEQSRIFEKFYRVNSDFVQNVKGSGLGLAVVKHIVEAHGGTIAIKSIEGKGSRFTISFPAEPNIVPVPSNNPSGIENYEAI